LFKIFEGTQESTNENYKTINFKSLKMKDVTKLCKILNKLYEEGYKIKEEFSPRECPKIPQLLNLKFIKETKTPEKEISVEKEIKTLNFEDLKTLDEMKSFAASNNIEIPEDITHWRQVKKFIKENLSE